MCSRKTFIGTACIAFGGGLVIATLFPASFIVFVFGGVLIAGGVLGCYC